MRRLVLIPVLLLGAGLTACSSFRDLFSAHADVAAEAGGQRLTPGRLAEIMVSGKGVRPNRDAANFVANVWIDYALFAQAVANGKMPLDSASIAQAVWPQLAELKGSHWHDTLMARRSAVPPNAADSVYRGNNVRVLQHILYRVPPNAVPEVKNTARKKAEGTLARIRRGAPSEPQGSLRTGIRQRRLVSGTGRHQRRRRDAVRLPHHQTAFRRCGPGPPHRLSGAERRWPAGFDLHGQSGHPQPDQGREGSGKRDARGRGEPRGGTPLQEEAGHLQAR
jgi:hypothetical protein